MIHTSKELSFLKLIWFIFVSFMGIIKKNIMICCIIQKAICIAKKCQFNKHLVFVTRNKSGGCSILHTESLVDFVLEE